MDVHIQLGHALVLVLHHSLNRHEFNSNYCVPTELTLYFRAHYCVPTELTLYNGLTIVFLQNLPCTLGLILSPSITLSMSLKPTGVQWKVRINTMKSALVKHILLVSVLWLLTCCTGAASEDYRRTMWVSTTGEDIPQCIHDTPTSDPVPRPHHLNESCGSLNYALTHIGNDTLIVIGCGIHVLEPVSSLLDGAILMNVTTITVYIGYTWLRQICQKSDNNSVH